MKHRIVLEFVTPEPVDDTEPSLRAQKLVADMIEAAADEMDDCGDWKSVRPSLRTSHAFMPVQWVVWAEPPKTRDELERS